MQAWTKPEVKVKVETESESDTVFPGLTQMLDRVTLLGACGIGLPRAAGKLEKLSEPRCSHWLRLAFASLSWT